MFGFVKKAVNAVSDTATSVSSSISDKASSTYSSVSASAGKVSEKISDAAQSAWPFAESVITDGLLDMTSDFLKDDEKIREVSVIFWQRIPREVRFFLSEEKFHERTKSLRASALLKLDESKQKRMLIDDMASPDQAGSEEVTNDINSPVMLIDDMNKK